MRSYIPRAVAALLLGLIALPAAASAQDEIPTTLTDKIFQGSGVIDLLKDVSPESLSQYLDENGQLLLGIDVNEANSGNESSLSQGIAIKQMELVIRTTAGDFTFSDFYTSTTAMLLANGSKVAQEYYTVFGAGGSSSIVSGQTEFSISSLDDVIYMDGIDITGTILSAQLYVTFLDTARTGANTSEAFFDYSNGFEDFALLSQAEAQTIESAQVGEAAAPSGVSYTSIPIVPATEPAQPTGSGAPVPPFIVLAALAAALLYSTRLS